MEIGFTDVYMDCRDKLNKTEKKSVLNAVKQIRENPANRSLRVHSIDREKCDPKFLSARVNKDLRLIFVKREQVYTMLYVAHHDDAYDWCAGKYLAKTDFGTEYIYDEILVQDKIEMMAHKPEVPEYLKFGKNQSLYEQVGLKKKDLEKLGISGIHADNLMKIDEEEELLNYIEIFPEEQVEALMDLAVGNKTYDVVYNQLFCQDTDMSPQDHEKRRFYTTDNLDELEMLMENDTFEKWTLFLHPSQERLVKMNCNGPMLIEGGPGTGKTIVGIHRAVNLAKSVYTAGEGKKILLCTFSKKLATTIATKIDKLCKMQGVENNIDVKGVDFYINDLLGEHKMNVNLKKLAQILERAYKEEYGVSCAFLKYEYHEVVERLNIKTRDEYLEAVRTGAGLPLNRQERERIWPYFQEVIDKKEEENAYSFVDRAYYLQQLLDNGTIDRVYDSIILDEAQDLESAKLSALFKSVKTGQNSFCILSDRNQRIFRLRTWSNDTGINVVGRSYYLKINYRTTKQIDDYARIQFKETNKESRKDKDYISIMNGLDPEIVACDSDREEDHIIVDKIKEYKKLYKANEICVLAPTYEKLNSIHSIMEDEGMDTFLLTGDEISGDEMKINLCTTSGVKGLEFSAVIISNYNKIGTQKDMYGNLAEVRVDYDKLVECEKYVAVTRARESVFITYVGEE